MHPSKLAGIDYGAKLAGTTVIAFIEKRQIVWQQSQTQQDADAFIRNFVKEKKPQTIGIDAPLSLPKVYKEDTGEDYFYRASDKMLGAMSPMFLGGLTARAMQLRASLQPIEMIEVYPSALAKKWQLERFHYKKSLSLIAQAGKAIEEQIGYKLAQKPENWHQFDAILAFASTLRYLRKQAEGFGNEQEGIIWV